MLVVPFLTANRTKEGGEQQDKRKAGR
jgi:hypothetical protein